MNKVISNHHILPTLIDLINNAKEYIVLISPYIKLNKHMLKSINDAYIRGVKVKVVYQSPKILDKIDTTPLDIDDLEIIGVDVYHIDDLHTKLYLSEKSSIITSMNLYDYSASSNEEIAVYTDDEKIHKSFRGYSKDLIKRSVKTDELSDGQKLDLDKFESQPYPQNGFCIRCKKEKDYNPYRPYCYDCYTNWKSEIQPSKPIKEVYCSVCGEEKDVYFKKPNCEKCNASITELMNEE
jgi:phosphatidylserine/phosphatidylglycerophosphate/cardiolipin synthase-like enzyme